MLVEYLLLDIESFRLEAFCFVITFFNVMNVA